MTKFLNTLVWRDFWKIAKAWYGVTEDAAELAHDWCSEYDFQLVYDGRSQYLEDLCDGLKHDIDDGVADAHMRNVYKVLREVLGDVDR